MLALAFSLFSVITPLVAAAAPATAPPQPPTAPQVRQAVKNSLGFVEKKGVAWLDNSKCIACHHGAWMVWSMNEARRAGIAVDSEKLDALSARVQKIYLSDVPKYQKKKTGWVESTYMLMSRYDEAEEKPSEWRTSAVAIISATQRDDGSWAYAGQGLDRSAQENDEATTLWALLALPKSLPIDSQLRDKAQVWLNKTPRGEGLDALALRVALAKRMGDASVEKWTQQLLARQQPDGGWKWSQKRESDAFATGEALYVLSLAGQSSESAAVQKACAFLLRTQKADGSWLSPTRKPTGETEISSYWATAWATIGLSRTLTPPSLSAAHRPASAGGGS